MKTLRNWRKSLLGAWRWNKMSLFEVMFEFPMTVEAESEEEAKETAKSMLFDHLGQVQPRKSDFEVVE